MQKNIVKKGLVIAIIVLFIGVSFQPIIAEKTTSVEKTSDYNNIDFEQAKEYLFQTIIDISNNPEVKQFLNEHKKDLFENNFNNNDCKNAIQKIWSQNPKLLKSILFTKPKMTYEYLEKNYNRGLEIINILGEEESLKIAESVKNINPELFNELNNIIENNKELSNRISVLGKINLKLYSNLTILEDFPIICNILYNILASLIFLYFGIAGIIMILFGPLAPIILLPFHLLIVPMIMIVGITIEILNCEPIFPPYPY